MRSPSLADSPVSNNGRGLKQQLANDAQSAALTDSPVSNNGRGLKPGTPGAAAAGSAIRPLAITGVD